MSFLKSVCLPSCDMVTRKGALALPLVEVQALVDDSGFQATATSGRRYQLDAIIVLAMLLHAMAIAMPGYLPPRCFCQCGLGVLLSLS